MAILIQVGNRVMNAEQIRRTRQWRDLAKAACPPGSVCYRCRKPILFGLRHGHPLGPSADHVIALDRGGAPFDPANIAPCHHGCNSAKGNRPNSPLTQSGMHAPDW
jgi:5-methylcytosine-specific restriction endonuclease McrA